MSNDLNLWNQFKAGDQKAFESIYRSEFSFLYQYGKKFSSDTNLVEDSIQDLFIEIWKNREKISSTDSIRRYLLVSLRRKVLKLIKSRSTTQLSDTPIDHAYHAELDVESRLVESETHAEKSELLKKAFSTLSDRQKEAFHLKYYGNCKNEEIAEIMGISNQSVRNLIHRGLVLLKQRKG